MKRILRHLLWRKKEGLPLLLAAMGFSLGLFILFGTIRFSGDVFEILYPPDRDTDSRFIVINKKVNLKHTLGMGNTSFTPDELDELQQQDFVREVGSIMTTNFAVSGSAYLGMDGGLQSELFFEAVDDRFLDAQPPGWHWQEGDTQIPAIIARDFLALYNFGYASAKGFPQLTEETIGLLQAQVVCAGKEKLFSFRGTIVGFSDRFATVLVPMTFMEWANANIGRQAPPPPSRVVLEVEPGGEERVQAFLQSRSYHTNQEKFPLTRVAGALQIALLIVCVFGAVLFLVSILSLVLFIQLLISRSKQELRLLHQLGFDDTFLTRSYMRIILSVISISFVLAGVGIWMSGFVAKPVLMKVGFAISPHPDPLTAILFALAYTGTVALVYRVLTRIIQRIQ
ncbi:ABC transporter permease [Planctomycetota bacterium]